MDRLKTGESNPRGIPKAKFLENIDEYLNKTTATEADVNNFLTELQIRLDQYKYMQESKASSLSSLNQKIPDIENTLETCKFLKSKSESDPEDTIDVDYQLNDTIYASASINPITTVSLWLGAGVMLEYPLDEAIDMLNVRLEKTLNNKQITIEDLDYLRGNITTMEVNTARVFNWDVQRRKDLKLASSEKNV